MLLLSSREVTTSDGVCPPPGVAEISRALSAKCKGAMRVINQPAKIAAESDRVEKHVFVRRVQEALSMARVRGNGWVWKKGLQAMAYGGGHCFQELCPAP
jgi:hypothetical protein